MTKTLRWKKTIGIIAIVLGALRCLSCIDALTKLSGIEAIIAEYSSSTYADRVLAHDLQSYVDFARIVLPFNCLITAAIFICGIVLLCIDKGLTDDMPRPKARGVTFGILWTSVVHFALEVASFAAMPSSLADALSTTTVILSLGFVAMLIIWCGVGLYGIPKTQRVLPLPEKTTDSITNNLDLTPQEQAAILDANPVPAAPLSPLDAEIEQLKKAIEKRKLEKEMAQIDAEKQAEIEQLKKELSELE